MVHVIDNRPSRIGFAGRRRRRPPRKDGSVYFVASNGKKIYDDESSIGGTAAEAIATSISLTAADPSNKPLPDSCAVTLSPCDEVKVSLTDASVQTMDFYFETVSAPTKVSAQTELIEDQQRLIENLLDQLLKKDIEIDQLRQQQFPSENTQQEMGEKLKTCVKQVHLLEEGFKNFRCYHVQKLQEAMCETEQWKKKANKLSSQLDARREQLVSSNKESKTHPPPTVTPQDSAGGGIHSPAIKRRTVYSGRFLFENPSYDMMDTSIFPTPIVHSKKLSMPTPDDRALRAILEVSSKKRKKPRIDQEPSSYFSSRVIHNRVLTFAGQPMPKLTRRHGNPQAPRCTMVIHSPIPHDDEDWSS
jgi:hypothetical protein